MRTSFISLILLLLLGACSRPEVTERLPHAERIMNAHPDSALQLLRAIDAPHKLRGKDRADYALLFTQACDKNYILQRNDSLIRIAVMFYDQEKNPSMQARTYYQWGSVLRDIHKQGDAVHKYLIAAHYAEATGQQKLLGRIYGQAANLYYLQDLNESADSIYQLVEQIASQTKDTLLLSESLLKRGVIYRERGKKYYSVAEELMLKAWTLLKESKYKWEQRNITSSLSRLYCHMQRGKEALSFAKLNYALQKDTSNCYWTYSLLGEAYYNLQQYDSAIYFLKKTLPISKYDTRAFVHMRLADIFKARGEYQLSLQHERLCSAYKDSVLNDRQSEAIIVAEKNLAIEQLQEKYDNATLITIYIVIGLLFLGAVLFVFLKRKEYYFNHKHEALSVKNKVLQNKNNFLLQELNEHKQNIDIHLIDAKIKRIIHSHKQEDYSEEELDSQEWAQFINYMNQANGGILNKLYKDFLLTEDEIRLCCLRLHNIPALHCAYLLQCSRDQIYKLGKRILEQKMGIPSKGTSLREELKKYIDLSKK